MMKQILKAGPNQMETLRRLRTEAAAIDKDVTVRSERIRQTRDFRIRFWFREKRWNSDSLHHSIRIHHTQARAATKRAEWHVRRSALAHLLRPRKTRHQRQHFCAKSLAICTISRDGVPKLTNLTSSPELDIIASARRIAALIHSASLPKASPPSSVSRTTRCPNARDVAVSRHPT